MGIIYKGSSLVRQPQDYGYVWPTIANDSSFPTISVGVLDGDRISVTSILSTEGPATFIFDSGEWKLISARVSVFANLATLQSTYTIITGAIVAVGAADNASAIRYYYNGSLFIQIGKGIIWQLTDLNTIDPLVVSGDYGILNNRTYIYHTFASGSTPDSISRSIWIPPNVSSASPVLRAYLFGTETLAQRNTQGWTSVTTNGTITENISGSGFTELTTTGAAGIASIDTLVGTVAAGTRIYMRAEMRGTGATDAMMGNEIGDGTYGLYVNQRGTVGIPLSFTDGTNSVQNTSAVMGGTAISTGGTYLPSVASNPSLIETLDNGRSDTARAGARIFRDGEVYHAQKRLNSVGTLGTRARFVCRRGGTGNGVFHIRNAYVITIT
jgi:hypothetical protein